MKKIFSLIAAVLFAGSMMAETVTLTIEDYAATEFSASGISVTTAKNEGTTAPAYNATGKDLRVYAKGSITLSSAQNITGISFVISTQGKKRLAPLTASVGEIAVAGDPDFTAVWSGSATEVTITVGEKADYGTDGNAKAGQLDFTAIEVTLDGEAPVTMAYYVCGSMTEWGPRAAYKLVANPEAEGEFMGEFTFAANDEFKVVWSDGATVTDDHWFPSGMENNYKITEAGDYAVYFRPDGQGGEGWHYGYIFAAKKETPVVDTKTCADVYSLAKGDAVELGDVVVTFANGKNVWVKDETASLLLYLSANTTWQAGDVLSGVAGAVDIYNGVTEVKPSADQAAAVVATPGEAPAPMAVVEVTLADVNKYIVLQSVEVEGSFTEGTQSNLTIAGVTVRNQFKNGFTFEAGKKYDVVGVVTIYQNNPQVYFISASESAQQGIEEILSEGKTVKVVREGKLVILKGDHEFTPMGQIVK